MTKLEEYRKQYYEANKEKICLQQKQRYIQNKETICLQQKQHYQKNKEEINKKHAAYRSRQPEYMKLYYLKNKQKAKEYYIKNKEKIKKRVHEKADNNLKSWELIIPKETNCQICGKKIYFRNYNRKIAIRFDHRHENEPIKGKPCEWLRYHSYTYENNKIWKSCNFGMLCFECNIFLPLINRKDFIINIVKYVFGKDFNVCNTRIQK